MGTLTKIKEFHSKYVKGLSKKAFWERKRDESIIRYLNNKYKGRDFFSMDHSDTIGLSIDKYIFKERAIEDFNRLALFLNSLGKDINITFNIKGLYNGNFLDILWKEGKVVGLRQDDTLWGEEGKIVAPAPLAPKGREYHVNKINKSMDKASDVYREYLSARLLAVRDMAAYLEEASGFTVNISETDSKIEVLAEAPATMSAEEVKEKESIACKLLEKIGCRYGFSWNFKLHHKKAVAFTKD